MGKNRVKYFFVVFKHDDGKYSNAAYSFHSGHFSFRDALKDENRVITFIKEISREEFEQWLEQW